MEKVTELHIEGMTCKSCVKKIQNQMTQEPGILDVQVYFHREQNHTSHI